MTKFNKVLSYKSISQIHKYNIPLSINKLKLVLKFLKLNSLRMRDKHINIVHNRFFYLKTNTLYFINRKNSKLYFQSYYRNLVLTQNKNIFDLYLNFVTRIFKSGKKSLWESSLFFGFYHLSLILKTSTSYLLLKLFLRLYTRVELRKVRSRKRSFLIPFLISPKRSLFLSIKWLILALKKQNIKKSLKYKLFIEIFLVLSKKKSESLNFLFLNNLTANKNRSNIHFRW